MPGLDPRLNSIHLEAPRREDYRRARAGLMQARGSHTLYAEQHIDDGVSSPSNTLMQDLHEGRSAELDCWLSDGEFLYPLKVGLNTVGRAPENDVMVPDAFISRRHCAIVVHLDQRCDLHDTASKNGTFLNGAKLLRPSCLKPGDEIRICERQFVFRTRNDKRSLQRGDVTISIS